VPYNKMLDVSSNSGFIVLLMDGDGVDDDGVFNFSIFSVHILPLTTTDDYDGDIIDEKRRKMWNMTCANRFDVDMTCTENGCGVMCMLGYMFLLRKLKS
jgi:hypothetical protein